MTRYAKVQRAITDAPLLLRTVHGSRLYGLAHENSDYDWYFVYDVELNRGNQSVHGDYDETVVPVRLFMEQLAEGMPKALEAFFSPFAERSPVLQELHRSYRVGATAAIRGTRRVMRAYARDTGFKNQRHALRSTLQLRDMMEYGRFNPVLTPERIALLNREAAVDSEDFPEKAERWLSWAVTGIDQRELLS